MMVFVVMMVLVLVRMMAVIVVVTMIAVRTGKGILWMRHDSSWLLCGLRWSCGLLDWLWSGGLGLRSWCSRLWRSGRLLDWLWRLRGRLRSCNLRLSRCC